MKRINFLFAIVLSIIVMASCTRVAKTGKMEFVDQTDSVSYALGYIQAAQIKSGFERWPLAIDSVGFVGMAKVLAEQEINKMNIDNLNDMFGDIDEEVYYKGFLNEFAYNFSYFTESTADVYLRSVIEDIRKTKDTEKAVKAVENVESGKKYLEENSKRPEVKVTESGLQYEILNEGNGPVASDKDKVRCQYHGTLIDGTVFDSSVERKDTVTFAVTGVIKGWTEALQLMPEGSKWRLYIPSDLAYGDRGAGADIGPNETLIFDLDLIEVVSK